MRAERKKGKGLKARGNKPSSRAPGLSPLAGLVTEEHISGAEGLYTEKLLPETVLGYIDRARHHPRGGPDRISITLERVDQKPLRIRALPLVTARISSPSAAEGLIRGVLLSKGISEKAVRTGFSILFGGHTMRGAALIFSSSGKRAEPDRQRGIRVSMLGISSRADKALSTELEPLGINTLTVKEALVLASKVASCEDVLAEVCVSDDPDYTTGYIASKSLGYIRIPHIKKKGDRKGGRVFFLRPDADIPGVIYYLEESPVIISSISGCAGKLRADEILNSHNQ